GGVLIFLGEDSDPYNRVRAWWNDPAKGMAYGSPREHLFAQLGLPGDAPSGTHTTGKGILLFDHRSPAALTYDRDDADQLRALVRSACEDVGMKCRETNYLVLRRGPYVVAAGLDESLDDPPHLLQGHFLDLFDAHLPILELVSLTPGSRRFLLDLDRPRPPG